VNEYLIDARKSIKPNPRRQFEEGNDDGGEDNGRNGIESELNKIMDMEKIHSEKEKFILAFNKNPEATLCEYIKRGEIHSDEPDVIAAYLIKTEGLDKHVLGEYFGTNNIKALKVLHSYCKVLNFKGIEFDKALRLMLSRFFLAGESQQV
jgi:brefeldin A-inhibited guanine nucleotide-exchange protein